MNAETRARRDAGIAASYAASCVIREERPPPGQTAADVVDGYATDLLDQIGADPERLYAAARAACIEAAEEVAHPGRWRPAIRAVDLCQRAVVLATAAPGPRDETEQPELARISKS